MSVCKKHSQARALRPLTAAGRNCRLSCSTILLKASLVTVVAVCVLLAGSSSAAADSPKLAPALTPEMQAGPVPSETLLPECNPCQDNQFPSAHAGSGYEAVAGGAVLFDGSQSFDSDGQVLEYHWSFSDGSWTDWLTVPTVQHTFDEAGQYLVKLWVRDNCGDISPAGEVAVSVATLDPCEGNTAPTAEAGADLDADVDEPLAFNGSASFDPHNDDLAYAWDFGDGGTGSGATPSHTFAAADTYTVTLTVTDICGAFDADTLQVTVTEDSGPEPLMADFVVRQLISVDPVTLEETWEQVGLSPDDPIESGLEVKLDATVSTGATYYRWRESGYLFGTQAEELVTYSGPYEYNIKLTVYDATGQNVDFVEKTVYVDGGMDLLSTMPAAAEMFRPSACTVLGTELWSVSGAGLVGVADISNPENLPALELMPIDPLNSVYDMASANGRLYVALGVGGVAIYQADRDDFHRLSTITRVNLGAAGVCNVAAVGNVLFIAAQSPGKIVAYDVANPSDPVPLESFSVPSLSAMGKIGSDALLAHNGGSSLTLLDIRNPQEPSLVEVAELTLNLAGRFQTYGTQAAVGTSSGDTLLLDLIVPANPAEPLALGSDRDRIVEVDTTYAALGAGRLFSRGYDYLDKYDIRQPGEPSTLMQEAEPPYVGSYPMFLFDPDGPGGPENQVLFVGVNFYGFTAYAP